MIWLIPTDRRGQPAAATFHCFGERKSLCGDWQRLAHYDPLEGTRMLTTHLCQTCRRRLKRVAGPIVWEDAP